MCLHIYIYIYISYTASCTCEDFVSMSLTPPPIVRADGIALRRRRAMEGCVFLRTALHSFITNPWAPVEETTGLHRVTNKIIKTREWKDLPSTSVQSVSKCGMCTRLVLTLSTGRAVGDRRVRRKYDPLSNRPGLTTGKSLPPLA